QVHLVHTLYVLVELDFGIPDDHANRVVVALEDREHLGEVVTQIFLVSRAGYVDRDYDRLEVGLGTRHAPAHARGHAAHLRRPDQRSRGARRTAVALAGHEH